ncbi:hypothetical protein CASFOL_036340 [Castilleja foliolosa]|uniref:Uncharacterized protein n=1 Tax=Castilleja foliolosa TaxID=1961234 RepID=A0ABD3BVE1_9LAMI
MGLDAKSEIVLALTAPIHIRQKPPLRPLAVAAFKFENLSHDVVAEELIKRLKLSGCAVISKGVLLVEGETSAINRFSKFVRPIVHKKPDSSFGLSNIFLRGSVTSKYFVEDSEYSKALIIDESPYSRGKFVCCLSSILNDFGFRNTYGEFHKEPKGPIADKISDSEYSKASHED